LKEEMLSYVSPDLRIDGHVTTDKVVYRPTDVIFIEVLLLEALTKRPIGVGQKDVFDGTFSLEVVDPSGTQVYTS
jgi:hypothetical protein